MKTRKFWLITYNPYKSLLSKIRKNIHTEKEEFREGPTKPLHYETKQEQPNVIRKPALIHSISFNKSQMVDTPQTMKKLIGIL